jgi:hypothetical protein
MEKKITFGLTTAGLIYDPERTFKIAGEINQGLPSDQQMAVEAYPVFRSLPGLGRMIITEEKLRRYQEKYGVGVSRIHNQFYYRGETSFQYNLPKEESWFPTRFSRYLHTGIMYFVGESPNPYGVNLAKSFGADLSLHPNVAFGLIDDDLLGFLKDDIHKAGGLVLAENSIVYNSHVVKKEHQYILGDPVAIAKEIVEPYGLDGLVYGADHRYGMDKSKLGDQKYLAEVTDQMIAEINDPRLLKYIRAMHIAGPGHRKISFGNDGIGAFLRAVGEAQFKNPVDIVLDLEPIEMLPMSYRKQLDYIKSCRDQILDLVHS